MYSDLDRPLAIKQSMVQQFLTGSSTFLIRPIILPASLGLAVLASGNLALRREMFPFGDHA